MFLLDKGMANIDEIKNPDCNTAFDNRPLCMRGKLQYVMSRSKSSSGWLQEHFDDEFVRRSQQEGYRSRAVYKLEEIHKKDRILKKGMNVVDLGAAPGGWSQYASGVLKGNGQIFALDILPMEPVDGVEFILGDFTEQAVLDNLLKIMNGARADLVLSDMAPNMSGIESVDIPRSLYLAELALDLSRQVLLPGGNLLVKLFQGGGFEELIRDLKKSFRIVRMRKPKASRKRSREIYALASQFIL